MEAQDVSLGKAVLAEQLRRRGKLGTCPVASHGEGRLARSRVPFKDQVCVDGDHRVDTLSCHTTCPTKQTCMAWHVCHHAHTDVVMAG